MQDFYSIKLNKIWGHFRHESWPFLLICLYLFFEYVRPQSIYPVIDVVPYSRIILILLMLGVYLSDKYPRPKNPLNLQFSIFIGVILLSSMFAYSTAMSLDNIELIFSWYLIYFLIIKVVNNEKRFFIFLLLYFLFNFKMSQHGFISWATNGFSFRTWGATGAPGWFHNSGEFGIEMCIFIPLLICFMASIRKNINNLRYAILIIVLITALGSIVASSSRGAVLGLAAMGIYAILKSKLSIKVVLAISLISIVSIYFMPAEFIQRFIEMGEDKSSVSRLTYWKAGIDMLKDNPVFGIGYNNWMLYYEKYYAIGGRVQLPHNVFIQAASELGLAGLFGFVLMIIYSLIINMRTRKISILNSNNFIYWMSHGFDIALVGMLTSGFFVTVLYYPFFWIYISFVVALNNVATKDNVVAEVA